MAVSAFSTMRTEIRRALRDSMALLFSDTDLDRIIGEAQREYSLYSGSLVSSFAVTSGTEAVLSAPADFIGPVKFIGSDGLEKPFISWKRLHEDYPDFRTVQGNTLLGIITDLDSFGQFRLFPELPEGTQAGTFFYRRLAVTDDMETDNREAVLEYALFTAFLLDGKSQAANHYSKFMEAVNREHTMQRSMKNRSRGRGRYF